MERGEKAAAWRFEEHPAKGPAAGISRRGRAFPSTSPAPLTMLPFLLSWRSQVTSHEPRSSFLLL